jgi:cellulose synthase/poly-beta-1,6-N-acetylglucosamine synthase-like glycosyltransferase
MAWAIWLSAILVVPLIACAAIYAGLNLILLGECVLALLPASTRHSLSVKDSSFTFAVLMPAHDEAGIIQETLQKLIPEVDDPQQILVVADNCTDATATLARHTGVNVFERTDAQRRGKGYALDFGLTVLAQQSPDVVVMMDADCYVTPGTIRRIAYRAFQKNQPVQAVYLMAQPPEPSLRDRISAFAQTVKNRVRAAGLSRLGVPVLLGGTAMAFPWEALQAVELASSHLVEDAKLGIDLAIAHYNPVLDLDSQVIGILPSDENAATSQRTRWEHGSLGILKTYVPRLFEEAIKQRRLDLLLLGLDVAIPPLALWSMIGIALTMVTGILAAISGIWLPLQIQLVADLLLLTSVLLSWGVWGRKVLKLSQLLAVPIYILWKIPIYLKALLKPETTWVRTKRNVR